MATYKANLIKEEDGYYAITIRKDTLTFVNTIAQGLTEDEAMLIFEGVKLALTAVNCNR